MATKKCMKTICQKLLKNEKVTIKLLRDFVIKTQKEIKTKMKNSNPCELKILKNTYLTNENFLKTTRTVAYKKQRRNLTLKTCRKSCN